MEDSKGTKENLHDGSYATDLSASDKDVKDFIHRLFKLNPFKVLYLITPKSLRAELRALTAYANTLCQCVSNHNRRETYHNG